PRRRAYVHATSTTSYDDGQKAEGIGLLASGAVKTGRGHRAASPAEAVAHATAATVPAATGPTAHFVVGVAQVGAIDDARADAPEHVGRCGDPCPVTGPVGAATEH